MKIKKWKKLIFAVALLAVLVISGISALFTDGDTMANIFTVGKVDIQLLEPNWDSTGKDAASLGITPRQEIAKDPQIKNIGANDAYVFMEVVVPYANITTVRDDGSNKETGETPLFSYDVKDGWVPVGDVEKNTNEKTFTYRYAYANENEMTALKAGGTENNTTPALFDTIRFANVVEDQAQGELEKLEGLPKEVVINAYAIQTDNINDGNILSDGNNDNGKVKPADVWEVLFNQRLVGYTPLEYIESTGTQHIDTGFVPNQDTRVVCDFQFTGVPSGDKGNKYHLGVFGARQNLDSNDSIAFALGYRYDVESGTSILRSDYNSGYVGQVTGPILSPEQLVNTRFVVDKDKHSTKINGETYSVTPGTFSLNNKNMYLFAFHSDNETTACSELRMYSCKIYDDGKLVRDFRPGISSTGKVGMYDAVTKQFYGNAVGDGEAFTPSPVLEDYVHDSANLILDGIWNSAEGVHSDTLAEGWVDLSGKCQKTRLGTGNTVGENCITSDGTDKGRMIVPDLDPINLDTFTLEFLFKINGNTNDNQAIIGRGYTKSYYINTWKDNLSVWLGNKENQLGPVINGTDKFLVQVTYTGSSLSVWLNGEKVISGESNTILPDPTKLNLFGYSGNNTTFMGSIFAMRLHNRVLTDEELAKNYAVDKKRFDL